MRSLNLFTILARTLIGLWAGIVLCGICSVRAQERASIDTLLLINTHADTVWLTFDDVLPLSVMANTKFHYLYRWFSNGKKIGDKNVLNYSFTGERKAKVVGQRFSTPFSWPGEEYLDMEYFKDISRLECDDIDTVYLKAFSEYESDSTATWIWTVMDLLGEIDTLFGPRIKVTVNTVTSTSGFVFVTCTLTTKTEEKRSPKANILFENDGFGSMRLTDSTGGESYSLEMFYMDAFRIYAHKDDTICLDGRANLDEIPMDSVWDRLVWEYRDIDYSESSSLTVSFDGLRYRDRIKCLRFSDVYGGYSNKIIYIYWGIKPNAEIESDSLWVFFPQYPYSNLGGRVDLCLPPDAPLPSAKDTLQVFNLGPWNRELEYVEYAWFDGTKDVAGRDSVVGTDSAFSYLFGRMDSLSPELYAGMLVTRVAADSLWQDSCGCYMPCTDDACHSYDTVRIYLHRIPSPKGNLFLPQDTTLCAHLDLELILPKAAEVYRVFWLDQDSVVLPYGRDTNRFTVTGMRGTDGFGTNTDTRSPRFFQLQLDHKLCGVSFFDTLLVYDQVKPAFELPVHDTVICLNEPIELDSLNPLVYRPFYSFEWNDGTQGSGYTFTDSGIYILHFFVKEDFAICGYDTASDTIYVRWSDPAQTLITLEDTSYCEKLSVILDATVPFPTTRYSWQEGNLDNLFSPLDDSTLFTSPILKVDKTGSWALFVVDTMNCVNTRQIAVSEEDCKPLIEIPNVFTPNGDGVNDVLKFKQIEYCYDVDILIVDRKGSHVLHQKLKRLDAFAWNGCLNNGSRKLPDGAYFYFISYRNVYGKKKYQSGSITILGAKE